MLASSARSWRRFRDRAVSSRIAALHRAGAEEWDDGRQCGRCGRTDQKIGAALRTALFVLAFTTLAGGQPIRIGVFSLFKPEEIVIAAAGAPLEIKFDGLTSRLEGAQSMA